MPRVLAPTVIRPSSQPSLHEQRQEYDDRRGSSAARGYGWQWRKASKVFLADNPLCAMCMAEGMVTAANVVDHIVPHRGDKALFWDRTNWQSLCFPHHDREKQSYERRQDEKDRGALKP